MIEQAIKNHADIKSIPIGTEKIIFLTDSAKDKFRSWFIKNAFSITLLAAAFIVTWFLLMILIITN